MAVITRRWTRSPRGMIFGVVTGLAEWRGLPADKTRLIVFIITVFTGIFPVCAVYLALALILPEQKESDMTNEQEYSWDTSSSRRSRHFKDDDVEDAVFREKNDEDLEKEYEELKKKVETMENDIFDKEKDWDNRFNRE